MDLFIAAFGYLASLLLAVSLLINNDLKFRWLNTLGCLSFIIYGAFLHAFPIMLTNALLLVINVVYLIKIYKRHEDFNLIEFKGEEQLVHKFLSFYAKDIKAYFPEYVHEGQHTNLNFVVLRDLVIANIFIAELQPDGTAIVKLNYTVPKYRDYKVGKFIFTKENNYLLSKGIKQLAYPVAVNRQHESFLKVMGFKKEPYAGGLHYVKHLD